MSETDGALDALRALKILKDERKVRRYIKALEAEVERLKADLKEKSMPPRDPTDDRDWKYQIPCRTCKSSGWVDKRKLKEQNHE